MNGPDSYLEVLSHDDAVYVSIQMQEMKNEEKGVLKLLEIDETFLQKKAVGLPAQTVRKKPIECSGASSSSYRRK